MASESNREQFMTDQLGNEDSIFGTHNDLAPARHVTQHLATTVCWELNFREEPMEWGGDMHVTRTLPVAEAVHRALVSLAGRGQVVDCPELIGQDRIGQPLGGRHEHAKILPLDLNGDQMLDQVLLHAPMGLGGIAQGAISCLNRLRIGSNRWVELQIVATDLLAHRSQRVFVSRLFPSFHGAKAWTSITPYVPPRFLKKSGKNSLIGQVQAELATRGFPLATVCEIAPELSIDWRQFVRCRREGKLAPPQDVGLGLRLEFAEPVLGPLALGYASHFGLGWFAAIEELR